MTPAPLPPDPALARALSDARRQVHHAAQFAAAVGISYLPHEPDDSHTNLEWLPELAALASRVIPARAAFRLAVRPADLSLVLLDATGSAAASLPLDGHRIDEATAWIRTRVGERGADPVRYTLARHYEIPRHPVRDGAAFDTRDTASFDQLGRWLATGAAALESLRAATAGASHVRCWPHHFDIALLIDAGDGRTVGVGLEPGDAYYDEPYLYVNMYPQPPASALTPTLRAGGTWHTHEWIGAALAGSHLPAGGAQRAAIDDFLASAVASARAIVGAAR